MGDGYDHPSIIVYDILQCQRQVPLVLGVLKLTDGVAEGRRYRRPSAAD
jgi:hypothetical protein